MLYGEACDSFYSCTYTTKYNVISNINNISILFVI